MGVVGRRRVWLAGGICGCGYQVGVFLIYLIYIPTALVSVLFCSSMPTSFFILLK